MNRTWHADCNALAHIGILRVRCPPIICLRSQAQIGIAYKGNWKQFRSRVKEQWGKLTDHPSDQIASRRDQLAEKLQELYGISEDEAEHQIGVFEARYHDVDADTIR